jgi:gamma-glutamylcyclotransferase (GGCT)/AIG2-like uncharacterized protein YtfP
MSRDLFVYGLLMFPELLRGLTRQRFAMREAVLPDHVRLTLRHPGWPPIGAAISAPGEQVDGVLLQDVDGDSLALLDRFEDLRAGLYTRCRRTVVIANGDGTRAEVYLCGDRVRAHLAGTWDPDAFASAYYTHYRDVVIPEFLHEYHGGTGDA